jgi:type IV secretory pathway VirB10-like protein
MTLRVLGITSLILVARGGAYAQSALPGVSSSPINGALSTPVPGYAQAQQKSSTPTVDQATSPFKSSSDWDLGNSIESPKTPYVVRAGASIPAKLIEGINSQLPGKVSAQVSRNVYDTATGNYILIPQGARLLGEYSSGVLYGQDRVMVTWQRITFPDGRTLDIGAMPGTDVAGASGFQDQVNNHYVRTFGSAILLSTIAGGISYAADKNTPTSDASGGTPVTAQGEVASQVGNTVGNLVNNVMQKNLNVSPTITIRPGYPFNVTVTKDITMQTPYANVYREP